MATGQIHITDQADGVDILAHKLKHTIIHTHTHTHTHIRSLAAVVGRGAGECSAGECDGLG